MRWPKLWCVLLVLFCIAACPLAFAQSAKPSDVPAQSKSTPRVATEDEVQQLRREVAELKAQIQRLVEASAVAQGGPAGLVQTNAVASSNPDVSAPVATPAAPAAAGSNADVSAPAATYPAIDLLQKEI